MRLILDEETFNEAIEEAMKLPMINEVMGPYPDFASCVSAQKKKGHGDESAHKICGYIKKQVGDTTTRGPSKK